MRRACAISPCQGQAGDLDAALGLGALAGGSDGHGVAASSVCQLAAFRSEGVWDEHRHGGLVAAVAGIAFPRNSLADAGG